MRGVASLHESSIGKKVLMAVTGALLVLYVIGHMLGNLKIFMGQAKIDDYAEFLRSVGSPVLGHGEFLWIARIVLLAAVLLHIWAAWSLTRQSRAARPVGYRKSSAIAANYASRTMRWGGVILAAFIVYHILHLTTGTVHSDFEKGRVYHNLVTAFSHWPVVLAYVVANVFLGLHLFHGVWSAFQTLGVSHPGASALGRRAAAAIAVVVAGGNISIALSVLTGLVR